MLMLLLTHDVVEAKVTGTIRIAIISAMGVGWVWVDYFKKKLCRCWQARVTKDLPIPED